MSYDADAKSDAQNMALEYLDTVLESYLDHNGEASDDFCNDYDDSYHHETHVDRDYSLLEAAELLDDLSEYEETDSGLWAGLEPRRAIVCQAAFTYGNAVMHHWFEIIREINGDLDLADLLEEYENAEDDEEEEECPDCKGACTDENNQDCGTCKGTGEIGAAVDADAKQAALKEKMKAKIKEIILTD